MAPLTLMVEDGQDDRVETALGVHSLEGWIILAAPEHPEEKQGESQGGPISVHVESGRQFMGRSRHVV
jgi:hypothetical protein